MTGVYDRPGHALGPDCNIRFLGSFDLAGPVTAASGRTRLIGGRTAMGIWATHYIGMLASHFPQEPESRPPAALRQAFVAMFLGLQIDGGKWSNIFSTDLSRSFNALAGLSGTVSVADPRQISLLLLLSNMSTTREPTS